MNSCLESQMILWSRGLIRSCDKLKSLYLHFLSVFGHKIGDNGNLPWWAPVYKIIWCFDHVVFSDHYIFTTIVSMDTKLGKKVIYLDELLPITSHDPLITWSYKFTWETKIIIFLLLQCLLSPSLTRWWFTLTSSCP